MKEKIDISNRVRLLGLGASANLIDFKEGVVYEVAPHIFACYVTIAPNSFCPNGVFETHCALDISKDEAVDRAIYESIERYCLGAIDHHQSEVVSWSFAKDRNPILLSNNFANKLFGNPNSASYMPVWRYDDPGKFIGYISVGDVFAPFPIQSGHCSSIPTSNGVALGLNNIDAAMRAYKELAERHSIMAFWYTRARWDAKIVLSKKHLDNIPSQLVSYFKTLDYEMLLFEVSRCDGFYVILSFFVQNKKEYPFSFCSAGASVSLAEAIQSAILEGVQTLLALSGRGGDVIHWYRSGAIISHLDHRMFYYSLPQLASSAITELYEFSKVADEFKEEKPFHNTPLISDRVFFADMTPKSIKGELSCVRAFSNDMYQLIVSDYYADISLIKSDDRFSGPHPFP